MRKSHSAKFHSTICIVLSIISIITLIILFIIKASSNTGTPSNTNTQNTNSTKNFDTFKHINKDGSFVIYSTNHKDYKVKKDFSKNKKVKHYEWYTDVASRDCINAHYFTYMSILPEILRGKLEIKFHPVNYLSKYSTNDYSLLGASYISGFAEYGSGNDTVYIMLNIYDSDTKEKLIKSTNLEKDFPKYLKEELMPPATLEGFIRNENKIYSNTVDMITKNKYKLRYAINQGSINLCKDKKLAERSPKDDKSIYVPFIFDNDKKDSKALITEFEYIPNSIVKPLTGKTVEEDSTICIANCQ